MGSCRALTTSVGIRDSSFKRGSALYPRHGTQLMRNDGWLIGEIASKQIAESPRKHRRIVLPDVGVGHDHPHHACSSHRSGAYPASQRKHQHPPGQTCRTPTVGKRAEEREALDPVARRQGHVQCDQATHGMSEDMKSIEPLSVGDGERIDGHPFDRQRTLSARASSDAAIVEGDEFELV